MVFLRIATLCLALAMSQAAIKVEKMTSDTIKAFLDEHNAARAIDSVPPLKWDESLSKSAASWGKNCKVEHSKNRVKIGENLYASGPKLQVSTYMAKKSVQAWVTEKKFKDKGWKCIGRQGNTCGHYTQVVWKDTTKVGCAVIQCDGAAKNFVVCQYSPSGNVIGRAPY